MKKVLIFPLLLCLLSGILTSCIYEYNYKEVYSNILIVSSVTSLTHGGGRFPVTYSYKITFSSDASCRDTVFVYYTTDEASKKLCPLSVGDTIKLKK